MKIISVACLNLNSLRGRQAHALDFEAAPLLGCGLFAISGPTGAGKTTLLDAITLALYGQTPRQKYGHALSSHGASESWAEVKYEVGGQQYLARWAMQWTFKKVGGTPKITMQVTPWPRQDGDWQTQKQTESIAKNAELTGMSYEQFTRSVLLAQGGFAEFLKAKDDDRADLLERMTGTGIYKELSKNAHERHRAEAAAQQRLHDQLGAVRLLSAEELAEKTADADAKWQAVLAAQATAMGWQAQLDWHQQVADLQDRTARAAAEIEQAGQALADHAPALARLNAHEPAEAFEARWREYGRATNAAAAAETRREALAQDLVRARAAETAAATATEAARHAWATAAGQLTDCRPALDAALAQLPRLKTLARAATEAETIWLTNEAAHDAAALKHGIFSKQTARDQQELTGLRDWLDQHRADDKLDSALVELHSLLGQRERTVADYRERHQEHKQLEADRQQAIREEADYRANLADTTLALTELTTTLRRQYAQHTGLHEAADARATILSQALAAARQVENDCRGRLLAKELFRDFAARLQPGCECPLCGALEHPVHGRQVDASDEALEQLQTELAALEEQVARLDQELKLNADLRARLSSLTLRGAAAPDAAAYALPLPAAMRAATLLLQDLADAPARQARLEGQHRSADEKLAAARARQGTLGAQIEGLQTKLDLILSQGEDASVAIEALAARLGTSFNRRQPQALAQELGLRRDTFARKARRHTELAPALATAVGQLEGLAREARRLAEARATLLAASEAAATERAACAAGIAAAHPGHASPRLALDHHLEAERAARQQHEQHQEVGRQHTAAVALHAERTQAQASLRDQYQAAAAALDAELRLALPAAGLPPDPAALDALLLPEPERAPLRTLRQRLDTALAGARDHHARALAELRALTNLARSAEPLTAVQQARDASHAAHLALVKEHTLLEKIIMDEQASQLRHAELGTRLAAQRAETLRWKALHELIGSADGTRFSRFAQGLTLARLVSLANHHLRQFSDRYQLRRKDATSLALLVADAYDECVREVSTLSGGETFLASLALALGLSELASNAARIDSLFIDEGFGTLDAETLHVALAALGSLRDRGKTIGIITHVDPAQLEGHIDTRVLVERVGQGSSRLRVLPELRALVPVSASAGLLAPLPQSHPLARGARG